MIISASRRTDIPAFYSDWFMNQIENGKIYRKNPYNNELYSNDISPDSVDVIVFWTRNAHNMIRKGHIQRLQDLGYNFYFQYTITGHVIKSPSGKNLDGNTPHPLKAIETFNQLSNIIGEEKVILRFDPIVVCDQISVEKVIKNYNEINKRINSGSHVVISFLDIYNHVGSYLNKAGFTGMKDLVKPENESDLTKLLEGLTKVNKDYGKEMFSCAESIDLEKYGIQHSKCIDDQYIQKVFGIKVSKQKDKGQREACGCVKSLDIGQYDTCTHGCVYCYATPNHEAAIKNLSKHSKNNGLIIPDERTWLNQRII